MATAKSSNNCIICLGTDEPLLNYEHTCGRYTIHEPCLQTWLKDNNDCFICREKIKLDIDTNTNTNTNTDIMTTGDSYTIIQMYYDIATMRRYLHNTQNIPYPREIQNPNNINMCRQIWCFIFGIFLFCLTYYLIMNNLT